MAAGEERRKDALILGGVRRIQRRLNGDLYLRQLVAPVWVAATVLALWRFFLRNHLAVATVLTLVSTAFIWWWRVRKGRVPLSHAAILADRLADAGGLLLTRLELPVGQWELGLNERVRALQPPAPKGARSVAAVGMALLFFGVAMLVPLPTPGVLRVNAAAASKVAQVEAQAEALAEEVVLDVSVESELARLREELADHPFDAADWEAADGLESSLQKQAAEAAARLSRAAEAARSLEEALGQANGGEAASQAREELERALQALERESGETSGASTPLSPGGVEGQRAQTSQLRQALEKRQQSLARAFGQGQARQMGHAQSGEQRPGGQSGGQDDGHASRLGQKGGPSRGGGEAELVFGAEARMDPDRLKFEPLPKGQGGEGEELWGLRAADPKPGSGPSQPSASGTSAEGEQGVGHQDGPRLPRNRELIRRYFDSPK
ncbi:MAG: hypothetical protein ACOZIN_01795 [Myxococcota bacterium]